VGHFPEHFRGDKFESKSHCLFTFFDGFFDVLIALLCNNSPLGSPKGNYHMVTGLGFSVVSQVARPALVAQGRKFPENITKVFAKSECVVCRYLVMLGAGIVLNTKIFQLWHETILLHVQINRTIEEIRPEQSFTFIPAHIMTCEGLCSNASK
jgi:hypothetical protein